MKKFSGAEGQRLMGHTAMEWLLNCNVPVTTTTDAGASPALRVFHVKHRSWIQREGPLNDATGHPDKCARRGLLSPRIRPGSVGAGKPSAQGLTSPRRDPQTGAMPHSGAATPGMGHDGSSRPPKGPQRRLRGP